MPSLLKIDAIWGFRPNNKPVTALDTLPPSTTALPVLLLVDVGVFKVLSNGLFN